MKLFTLLFLISFNAFTSENTFLGLSKQYCGEQNLNQVMLMAEISDSHSNIKDELGEDSEEFKKLDSIYQSVRDHGYIAWETCKKLVNDRIKDLK